MPLEVPEDSQPDIVVVMPTSQPEPAAVVAAASAVPEPIPAPGASGGPQPAADLVAAREAGVGPAEPETVGQQSEREGRAPAAAATSAVTTATPREQEEADGDATDSARVAEEVGVSVTAAAGDVVVVGTVLPQVVDDGDVTTGQPQVAEEVPVATGVPQVAEEVPVATGVPQVTEEVAVTTGDPRVGKEVAVTTVSPVGESASVSVLPQVQEAAAVDVDALQAVDDIAVTAAPASSSGKQDGVEVAQSTIRQDSIVTVTPAVDVVTNPSEDSAVTTVLPAVEEGPVASTPLTSEDLSANMISQDGEGVSVSSERQSAESAASASQVAVTDALRPNATAAAAEAEDVAVVTTGQPVESVSVNITTDSVAEDKAEETETATPAVVEASAPTDHAAVTTAGPDLVESEFSTASPVTQDVPVVDAADKEVVAPEVAVVTGTEPPQVDVAGAALDAVTNIIVESVTSTVPVVTARPEAVVVTEVVEGIDEVAVTAAAPTTVDVTDAPVTRESSVSVSASGAPVVSNVPVGASKSPEEVYTEAVTEALEQPTTEAVIEVAVNKDSGQQVADLVSTSGTLEAAAVASASPMTHPLDESKPGSASPAGDKVSAAEATTESVDSTAAASSTTEASSGVTRGGVAQPINQAATQPEQRPEAHVSEEVEARPVVAKAGEAKAEAARPSQGRSLAGSDGVVSNPDCPKDVMEADARFVVILVLLAALSVLGVSVVVLVMKFRVKPAARRSITMSMCWCLRRARRATITPPFAHSHHHQHPGEVGARAAPQPPLSLCQYSSLVNLEAPPTA
ncbi:Zonadhesin [Frankliniella fusca]|uniref:Zonadhesin n=1 Tax=Frankliniella fusca TaxID=407009 RepID=A0AAE1I5Z1_9NEOP|nr:Zonadhesin [Frankliniella fusca]